MKRVIRNILVAILSLTLVLAFAVGCGGENGCAKDPTGQIILSKSEITMKVLDEVTLTYELKDVTGDVTWSSSDSTVVTVTNGTLTGKKAGTATVTAKVGEISASCAVTVLDSEVRPVLTIDDASSINLLSSGTYKLSPVVTFKGEVVSASYTFASSVASVATIANDGTITAVADGESIITVTANYQGIEVFKTIPVIVSSSTAGIVTMNGNIVGANISMGLLENVTISVSTLFNGNMDDTVQATWSTTDDEITIVANGKTLTITSNKAGVANVKLVLTKNNVTNERIIPVNVTKKEIDNNTSILIDKSAIVDNKYSVELPTAIDASEIVSVSVGGVKKEVLSFDADDNTVEINVAGLPTGENAFKFEGTNYIYNFKNSVFADMVIWNKTDLDKFGLEMINSQTGGKYYALGANIDYGNQKWNAGWANSSATFAGTFNGCGYTLSNFDFRQGIFADMTSGSVVKNLCVNTPMTGNASGGTIARTNYGTIENCMITTNVTKGDTAKFSFVVAGNDMGVIRNCIVKVTGYVAGVGFEVKDVPAITAGESVGSIYDCYAISAYSDYMYGTDSTGLYADSTAFFASVTALSATNGWNSYWSISDGQLFFNGVAVA